MSATALTRHRTFALNSLSDVLLIGGGVSLIFVPLTYWVSPELLKNKTFILLVSFFVNAAHFATSILLLYEKGNRASNLFLKRVFPIIVGFGLVVGCYFVEQIGRHLVSFYLTWAPFHYTTQTYGLALIYCCRAGVTLQETEKKYLWWVAVIPFFWAFFSGLGKNEGLGWFLTIEELKSFTWMSKAYQPIWEGLRVLAFSLPILFLTYLMHTRKRVFYVVGLLLISNATWWVLFSYWGAFFWATVAHALQYLAIAIPRGAKTRSEGCVFYAKSLILAYAIFHCLPFGCMGLGLGYAEAVSLTFAMANLHHFVVDSVIWKARPSG